MEVPTDREVFDRPSSTMWFDDDGILCSLSKKNPPPQTLENVKENVEWIKKLLNGKKVCMLSENKYPGTQPSKEVRQYAAEEIPKITKALAFIAHSPLSKMIANLFFALYPPNYPVKMFDNEQAAREWLKQYL